LKLDKDLITPKLTLSIATVAVREAKRMKLNSFSVLEGQLKQPKSQFKSNLNKLKSKNLLTKYERQLIRKTQKKQKVGI
jgi:hypothetical protein